NDAMRASLDTQQFCTAALARLESHPDGVEVTVSLGGHPPAWVLRADGRVEELGDYGMLIGSFPEPRLTETSTRLLSGDALLLYTDGLAGGDLAGLNETARDPRPPPG